MITVILSQKTSHIRVCGSVSNYPENEPPIGPFSFLTCPYCDEDVILEETSSHGTRTISGEHSSAFSEGSSSNCPVSFMRCDYFIRRKHSFLPHQLPMIFAIIPREVSDEEILEECIRRMRRQNHGTSLRVQRKRNRIVHVDMWRSGTEAKYWGLVRERGHSNWLHAAYSMDELLEFALRWFY